MEKIPHIVWDDVEMFHIDIFLPLSSFAPLQKNG